ncbi:MAG: hypothetical protein QW815_03245, partial [Nitrososphaerota archaeon]
EASPIAKYKVGPIPLISIAGAITSAFFIYIAYSILTTPALTIMTGPAGAEAITVIIVSFILGPIIYYGMRAYRLRKEGIDISLAAKEIPPG